MRHEDFVEGRCRPPACPHPQRWPVVRLDRHPAPVTSRTVAGLRLMYQFLERSSNSNQAGGGRRGRRGMLKFSNSWRVVADEGPAGSRGSSGRSPSASSPDRRQRTIEAVERKGSRSGEMFHQRIRTRRRTPSAGERPFRSTVGSPSSAQDRPVDQVSARATPRAARRVP